MEEYWDVRDAEIILKEKYESRGANFPSRRVQYLVGIFGLAFIAAERHGKPVELPR